MKNTFVIDWKSIPDHRLYRVLCPDIPPLGQCSHPHCQHKKRVEELEKEVKWLRSRVMELETVPS